MSLSFRCPTLSGLLAPAACWLALVAPAQAAAPNPLTVVDFGPQRGNALAVARVANNAGTGWTWQLNGTLTWRHNNVGETLSLRRITISYPGANPSISSRDFPYNGSAAETSDNVRPGIFDGHDRDLTTLPPLIRLEIKFAEYTEPAVLQFPLTVYENTVPGGALFFPTKQSDLPDSSWRYQYDTRHTMDQIGGDQRWGYDIWVARWNGSAWSQVKSSAESTPQDDRLNSDFLIWGTPLYAMGDGTVVACYDGEVDHDPQSEFDDDNPTWEIGVGNHLEIDYGGDRVVIAHNQHDSIPDDLCPGAKHTYHTGLNIPVRAGEYIGRVGNTGRSTHAHIHLHVYNEAADDTSGDRRAGRGVPANFRNLRSAADQFDASYLGQNPSLGQHDGKVLHRHSLFQPNPCGYPEIVETATERSFVHLTSECYQDMYNVATAKGWVPNLLDGFEMSGLFGDVSRFNATFRPGTGASWAAYHDQSAAQMADTIVANVIAGRQVHVIDAYKSGSQVRYAAVFFNRRGPDQDVLFDRSQAQWEAEFADMTDAGYVPVNVAVVEDAGGALRFTSVWEQFGTQDWTLQIPPAAEFASVVADEEAAGRKPVYVNAFTVGSTAYVTGLFVGSMGGVTTKSIGVESTPLSIAMGSNLTNGRPIRAVAGYDIGVGSPRFAAVWRSPINTTITSGPTNGGSTTSRSATFTFDAHHPFAIEYRCRKSGGLVVWLSCTSPRTYTDLALGEHSFAVRATDRDLLTDPTPPSSTWTVTGTVQVNALFADGFE